MSLPLTPISEIFGPLWDLISHRNTTRRGSHYRRGSFPRRGFLLSRGFLTSIARYEHQGIVFLWGESYAASALAGFSVLDQFLSLRSSLTQQLAVVPVLLQIRRYFAERTEFFYLDVTSLANSVLPLPMGNKVSLVLYHVMFSSPGSISSWLAKLFCTFWVYKFWKCSYSSCLYLEAETIMCLPF